MDKKSQHLPPQLDVIIVGSGASSLCLALHLAEHFTIAIITKDQVMSGSSPYAQGGIAAATGDDDNAESHTQDTIQAGANLNHTATVKFTTEAAPEAIRWLQKQGVEFTREKNGSDLHRSKEGGHSVRRVLHVDDKTGHAILQTLRQRALNHSNIHFLEHHTAIDCVIENNQCIGITCLRTSDTTNVTLFARICVLASGGANSLYPHTTNPWMASGDGIAMAWRTGCRIANMEFHQFHPTAFYNPGHSPFLITEALRGEGAKLTLPKKQYFMPDYHPKAELAPRDIVARAIHQEIQKNNLDHVYLDVTHLNAERIKKLFPTIYQHCLDNNIDITSQWIPVIPASHYTCGGVITDLSAKTDISHLYAIGETAHTGLHGANRMASNSLLECLVFAESCAKSIHNQIEMTPKQTRSHLSQPVLTKTSPDPELTYQTTIRNMMWKHVGIVRNDQGLKTAFHKVNDVRKEFTSLYPPPYSNRHIIETNNLIDVAFLTITCALQRKESRGLHYNTDHPNTLQLKLDSIVTAHTNRAEEN